MALGDVIARLSVSLGLETAAFEKGSRRAQQEVKGLRGQMTTAAKAISGALAGMVTWETVKQLRDWTQAAVDSAGALGEQAAALGVSTDALQEYRYAATQVGLESAEMDKALEQLTRRMGDAAIAGKGPIVEAFKALGITLDDLKGKTAGDVIPLIADGMAKIEDPARRASIAVDLFGKSGQKLATLLQGGSAEVNNLRQAAHDLGIVLSESDIAKADEVADKVAALRYVLEAQQNKKLLENADALLKYEEAVGALKMGLIEAVGEYQNWARTVQDGSWAQRLDVAMKLYNRLMLGVPEMTRRAANAAAEAVRNMVSAIAASIGGTLRAVWDGAIAKLGALGAKFAWLYDVVVGHSYIPDMVDGIAAHMARLDAVMVNPATKATKATAKEFQALRDLLDRLFPEVGRTQGFNADLARIQGSALNDNQKDEAVRRLWNDFLSGSPFGSGGMGGPDFGSDGGPLVEGIEATEEAIQRLTDRSRINTVRIAQSFKDMADETLQSLGRLTNAIKSGGFLGILEAVIGLGLQLGSIGAFGKNIATRLNSTGGVKGFATGTLSAPRGLALVGERGPELVKFSGGERVYNNRDSRGMMGGNVYHIQGNLLTPEFWGMIQAGDIQAAQGGAMLAGARKARSDKWSLSA